MCSHVKPFFSWFFILPQHERFAAGEAEAVDVVEERDVVQAEVPLWPEVERVVLVVVGVVQVVGRERERAAAVELCRRRGHSRTGRT